MHINTLQHHFLIAMPNLDCPMFSQTVVYLNHHDRSGAKGLIINKPSQTSLDELLNHLSIHHQDPDFFSKPVYCGGPVDMDQGWVAHRDNNKHPNLNNSRQALELITDKTDEPFIVGLGLAEWKACQLDDEIKAGFWLIAPYDETLMFNYNTDDTWAHAMRHCGIESHQVSGQIGHA